MVSDKKLFEIMIKYHPTFVGWLIHNGIVEKSRNKLVLKQDKKKKKGIIKEELTFKVLKVYEDGIKLIDKAIPDWNQFPLISLTDRSDYKYITKSGIDIFESKFSNNHYCRKSQLKKLIKNFADIILEIRIPDNFPRLKGKIRDEYFKILEKQIAFIKNDNYRFSGYYNFYANIIYNKYDTSSEKEANIKRYGIFANDSIYEDIEWDFNLVEKYKDQIIWTRLINNSNLIWEEEKLIKYYKYIPFCITNAKTYCDKYKSIEYDKFGFLSNNFLENYKYELDWRQIFTKCKIQWDGKEMKHFFQYALNIKIPYDSVTQLFTYTISQIKYSFIGLIDNNNFHWTQENLLTYLSICEDNWQKLVAEHRPDLFRIFRSIPNIKILAEPHIKDIKNFWEIINNEHDFPYDDLIPEFTIENIKINITEWSKPLRNIFLTMLRTSDTNYHFYYAETQWDIFRSRINIPLNYELAKYLSGIEIKIGGTFVMGDDVYMEEDHRFPVFNGLEVFAEHHLASFHDKMMCLEDEEILDILLCPEKTTNIDLVKTIITLFFKDYTIKDYIDIINKQKDWKNYKIFS